MGQNPLAGLIVDQMDWGFTGSNLAGIDALRLRDGRFLLVYNPTTRGRRRLAVAVSDDGRRWRRGVDLENAPDGEYSYPAMIQAADGLVHVTYTWRRQRIRHVVFDPARIP